MVWYFNFCAPALSNDPTINFFRLFQIGILIGMFVIYVLVHVYYLMCGPQPFEQRSTSQSNFQQKLDESSQNQSDSDKGLKKDGDKSEHEVSMSGAIMREENSSYVTFSSKPDQWREHTKASRFTSPPTSNYKIVENVTIKEVQEYFPIILGHFSIIVAFTIMYSPYFEQSVGMILYAILALILVFLNARRYRVPIIVLWFIMGLINIFLILSGMVEVGQANYNKITAHCFVFDYTPLY